MRFELHAWFGNIRYQSVATVGCIGWIQSNQVKINQIEQQLMLGSSGI